MPGRSPPLPPVMPLKGTTTLRALPGVRPVPPRIPDLVPGVRGFRPGVRAAPDWPVDRYLCRAVADRSLFPGVLFPGILFPGVRLAFPPERASSRFFSKCSPIDLFPPPPALRGTFPV